MIYLISHLWPWLLLALGIGLVVGWKTYSHEPTRWWTGWIPWGTIVFLIGLLLAATIFFHDRTGYWLDAALLMFGAYIIGCLLCGLWRQWREGGGHAAGLSGAAVATGALGAHGAASAHGAKASASPARLSSSPVIGSASPSGSGGSSGASGGVAKPASAAAPAGASAGAGSSASTAASSAASTSGSATASASTPGTDGDHAGVKPAALAGPRGGKADDLKRIRGIGKQNEGRLHGLGIWHFDQIAAWTADEVEWVGSYLAFPGRIEREDWQAQARVLATGADTDFSKRVDRGEVATSKDDGGKGQANVADVAKLDASKPKPN